MKYLQPHAVKRVFVQIMLTVTWYGLWFHQQSLCPYGPLFSDSWPSHYLGTQQSNLIQTADILFSLGWYSLLYQLKTIYINDHWLLKMQDNRLEFMFSIYIFIVTTLTLSQCTLAGPVYTGTPLECHWLTQCTLEHHWKNLVETSPHCNATGES